MPTATSTFHGRNGTELTYYRWDPDRSPVAAVQIAHGMGEHALRYDSFAQSLAAAGFTVYAHDHRGHGASAAPGALGTLGDGGWPALVAEIGDFGDMIRDRHPGLRLGLVAHSMGSFATQQFLLTDSARVDAVALTGTASIDLLEPALDLDAPLDLAMFNTAFQPQRTDYDWLSRDEAIVDAYIADPKCGFGLDTDSVRAMFAGSRALADPDRVAAIRSDLPIYLAVGEQDPVNAGLALFNPLVDRLRAAGVKDLTVHVYPGARHEVLNETNRAEIIAELTGWLHDRLH
jgi:alpha-beta hydrolase superfamily lysophospholipase